MKNDARINDRRNFITRVSVVPFYLSSYVYIERIVAATLFCVRRLLLFFFNPVRRRMTRGPRNFRLSRGLFFASLSLSLDCQICQTAWNINFEWCFYEVFVRFWQWLIRQSRNLFCHRALLAPSFNSSNEPQSQSWIDFRYWIDKSGSTTWWYKINLAT